MSEVVSVRLDKSTNDLLEELAKRLGISKSFLIQQAIRNFISQEELPKELEKYLKLKKAQELLREIKIMRYIVHQYVNAERYLKSVKKAQEKRGKEELKNAKGKTYSILASFCDNQLKQLEEKEMELIRLLKQLMGETP